MFIQDRQLFAALATMAFPSVEQFEPALDPRHPRRARKNPGPGGRALMEDTPDDLDDPELKETFLWDKGVGTITPGPNTGPAIQVSSARVRAMSTDILAGLNLI
jgi:hypothetical protein